MATTTTLKLPDALKLRIAPLAEESGRTPHAWMVEALEAQAALAEQRGSFYEDARASLRQLEESGTAYRAEDVHAYLRAKVKGKRARRPRAVKG